MLQLVEAFCNIVVQAYANCCLGNNRIGRMMGAYGIYATQMHTMLKTKYIQMSEMAYSIYFTSI